MAQALFNGAAMWVRASGSSEDRSFPQSLSDAHVERKRFAAITVHDRPTSQTEPRGDSHLPKKISAFSNPFRTLLCVTGHLRLCVPFGAQVAANAALVVFCKTPAAGQDDGACCCLRQRSWQWRCQRTVETGWRSSGHGS
jgi:hypothetical protein